jgi:hypothetical protein
MPKTPIERYLDAWRGRPETVKAAAQKRDQEDLDVWSAWKKQPTKNNMSALLDRMKPVFDTALRKYKAPNVNEAAFVGNMYQHAINGIKGFDPQGGASLRTHVTNSLKKSNRFNMQNQNVAYIPEDKVRFIGHIDAARDQIRDEGREPTNKEVASLINQIPKMRITPKRIDEIDKLRMGDVLGSMLESDPLGHVGSRDREVISLLRDSLATEDEKTVYDYIYGKNGKPRITSTNDLAKRMGKSPSQIARLKTSISNTYKKYV